MRTTRARNEAPARRDVLRLLLGGAGLVLAGCDGTTGLRRVHFTLYAGGPTAATGGRAGSGATARSWLGPPGKCRSMSCVRAASLSASSAAGSSSSSQSRVRTR